MYEEFKIFFESTPCLIFMAGAAGALIAQILKDNCLELPKKIDGKMTLGFFGGVILGGTAGYFVDGSPEMAFLAGFAGKEFIERLIAKKAAGAGDLLEKPAEDEEKKGEIKPEFADIESMIRWKAERAGVNPDLAVRVAKCESGLNYLALNVNSTGSRDRGLYQWNDKYHPEITDDMAFNAEIATDLFLKAFKAGHLNWWKASKKCWDTKNEYPNI